MIKRLHHPSDFTLHEHRFLFEAAADTPKPEAEKAPEAEKKPEGVKDEKDVADAEKKRVGEADKKLQDVKKALEINRGEQRKNIAPQRRQELQNEEKTLMDQVKQMSPEKKPAAEANTPEEKEARIKELTKEMEDIQNQTKTIKEKGKLTPGENQEVKDLSARSNAIQEELDALTPPKTYGERFKREMNALSREMKDMKSMDKFLAVVAHALSLLNDFFANFGKWNQKIPVETKAAEKTPEPTGTPEERVNQKIKNNEKLPDGKAKDVKVNMQEIKKQNEDKITEGKKKIIDVEANLNKATQAKNELAPKREALNKSVTEEKDEAKKKQLTEDLKKLDEQIATQDTLVKQLTTELEGLKKNVKQREEENVEIQNRLDGKPAAEKKEEKKDEKKTEPEKKDVLEKYAFLKETAVNTWVDSPFDDEKNIGVRYIKTEGGKYLRLFANTINLVEKDGSLVNLATHEGITDQQAAATLFVAIKAGGLDNWCAMTNGYDYFVQDGPNEKMVLRERFLTKDANGKILESQFKRYKPGIGWTADSV